MRAFYVEAEWAPKELPLKRSRKADKRSAVVAIFGKYQR